MRAQEKTLQGWRRLLGGLIRDPRERLLAWLEPQARQEATEAARLRADAKRLRQLAAKRQRLLAIARRDVLAKTDPCAIT